MLGVSYVGVLGVLAFILLRSACDSQRKCIIDAAPHDPSQASSPLNAAHAESTADDLLAQMAGEEIDKLLADAEIEPTTSEPAIKIVKPVVEPAKIVDETHGRDDAPVLKNPHGAESGENEKPASPVTPNPPQKSVAVSHDGENSHPATLVLDVLEFVNSPLDVLPESAREAIGKIGLITLVNAVAILIYVLVIRRR